MTALALAPPPLPTTTAYREATEKFNRLAAPTTVAKSDGIGAAASRVQ